MTLKVAYFSFFTEHDATSRQIMKSFKCPRFFSELKVPVSTVQKAGLIRTNNTHESLKSNGKMGGAKGGSMVQFLFNYEEIGKNVFPRFLKLFFPISY